jgi:uncharacterized membrane protein (DUF2068 family)
VARRQQPPNRYELITCGWSGHALVGRDAGVVTEEDGLLVRDIDGVRWCRCLRCDSWIPEAIPEKTTTDGVPGRDEIELPLRGPALRDRYILRLIALDRVLHVTVLTLLAIAFLTFASHDKALHTDYGDLMNALNGGGVAASRVRGLLGYLHKAFEYSPTHLVVLALIFLAFAALEGVEAVGLWWAKRWAEYLTLIATSLLVPYEIYELTLRVSILKVVAFVVNLLVVLYLLYAKRLFGVRGGHAVVIEQRNRLSGWQAIEEAQPVGPIVPTR